MIEIVVRPEARDPSRPARSYRFIATVGDGGRVLGAFTAPLLGSARVLLAEGILPEAELGLRHYGSSIIALRSTVGGAARLAVSESGGDGTLRFVLWRAFVGLREAAE
jgi:hypothetical protein